MTTAGEWKDRLKDVPDDTPVVCFNKKTCNYEESSYMDLPCYIEDEKKVFV